MTIWQMSLGASGIILAATVIRALALYRLPKNTFLIFWAIALIRLLVPLQLSIVLPFSMAEAPGLSQLHDTIQSIGRTNPVREGGDYSGLGEEGLGDGGRYGNAVAGIDGVGSSPGASGLPGNDAINQAGSEEVEKSPPGQATSPTDRKAVPWLGLIWGSVALCIGLYVILKHMQCRKNYRFAIPAVNESVDHWLSHNTLPWRRVEIKVSTDITAPMTYGLWRPVILLPSTTNMNDWVRLQYILTHEMTHIRRCDTLWKWLMLIALCVHWFNPLVWVMCVLANRDLELTCDEIVVRRLGEKSKKTYALTLVELAQEQIHLIPLGSGFSKKPLEERIAAILRYRKSSRGTALLSCILVVGVSLACALRVSGFDGSATTEPDSAVIMAQAKRLGFTVEELDGQTFDTLNLDGVGDNDDTLYVSRYRWSGESASDITVLQVMLGTGEYCAKIYPGGHSPSILFGHIRNAEKQDIVLTLESYTSTYGAAEIYLLEVLGATDASPTPQLVETLELRDELGHSFAKAAPYTRYTKLLVYGTEVVDSPSSDYDTLEAKLLNQSDPQKEPENFNRLTIDWSGEEWILTDNHDAA